MLVNAYIGHQGAPCKHTPPPPPPPPLCEAIIGRTMSAAISRDRQTNLNFILNSPPNVLKHNPTELEYSSNIATKHVKTSNET